MKNLRQCGAEDYTRLIQVEYGYAGAQLIETAKLFGLERERSTSPKMRFLKAFVLSCWLAVQQETGLREQLANPNARVWISYSRSQKTYRALTRYGREHASRRNVVRTVDRAAKLGLVETTLGAYARHERSRFRPIGKFLELLLKLDVSLSTVECLVRSDAEVLHLKGCRIGRDGERIKYMLDYADTDVTRQMRANLRLINAHNSGHRFEVCLDDELKGSNEAITGPRSSSFIMGHDISRMPELLLLPRRVAGDTVRFDMSSRHVLHRVFNDGVWDRGGRFYGSLIQNMPRELRARLMIDGQPTVEVDYSGMHVRMLYHLAGIECPYVDPYDVSDRLPAWPDKQSLRGNIKVLALTCLNAKSAQAARMALEHSAEVVLEPGFKVAHLMKAFTEHHSWLKDSGYLWSGIGMRLQHLDSQIAERIMLRFAQAGLPIVPIHDSFVVRACDEAELRNAMREEYLRQPELHGFASVLKSKVGLGTVEIDTSAMVNTCSPRRTTPLRTNFVDSRGCSCTSLEVGISETASTITNNREGWGGAINETGLSGNCSTPAIRPRPLRRALALSHVRRSLAVTRKYRSVAAGGCMMSCQSRTRAS